MRLSAMAVGAEGVTDAERVITVVYAVVIVLSAPIDIVLTRYSADRVYEHKHEAIAAPLRRALATTMLVFCAVGSLAMKVVHVPSELALPGVILATIVGGQWLLLSAAAGLSAPGIILRAFAAGAPVSFAAWWFLSLPQILGDTGYLYGFALGQLVTLSMLLYGTLKALPKEEDDTARLRDALGDYWLLAIAAFAFNAGLWVDKLIVLIAGGEPMASQYAALAAVAWLSVVPACAYLFVTVETVFHRRFNAFYAALHDGASLPELEALASEVRSQVFITLRGTAAVQGAVTLLCLMVGPVIVANLGLGGAGAYTISWLLVGAGLQVLAVASILLLYYFDYRGEALVASITQLASNTFLTTMVGIDTPHLGIGYTVACVVTCAVSIGLLSRRMPLLLQRTFQSQPYAYES